MALQSQRTTHAAVQVKREPPTAFHNKMPHPPNVPRIKLTKNTNTSPIHLPSQTLPLDLPLRLLPRRNQRRLPRSRPTVGRGNRGHDTVGPVIIGSGNLVGHDPLVVHGCGKELRGLLGGEADGETFVARGVGCRGSFVGAVRVAATE